MLKEKHFEPKPRKETHPYVEYISEYNVLVRTNNKMPPFNTPLAGEQTTKKKNRRGRNRERQTYKKTCRQAESVRKTEREIQ